MNGEAAPSNSTAVQSVSNASTKLAEFIQLNTEKKAAQKVLDDITEKYDAMKEQIKNLFIDLGVNSMKSHGKNVYISKKIWASIDQDVQKDKLSQALIALNMDDYITCNAQKLSSYVREIVADHPEFHDAEGNIIATPEEIAKALPEPFDKMFKVTEKMDVSVRK